MKKISCLLLLCLLAMPGYAQSTSIPVVPTPAWVTMGQGQFVWNEKTVICTDAGADSAVRFLIRYLQVQLKQPATFTHKVIKSSAQQPVVYITSKVADQLPTEGYRLVIAPYSITLTGQGAGLFYGIQSLLQLFPATGKHPMRMPCLSIEDHPRFGYRGLMLDVSRHFFTVSQIKDLLDLMAVYKLNRFHWHLTDDQGWRLEIKHYPRLTQVGAWRVPRLDFSGNTLPPQSGEKATDGGYYTQQEVKEIIRYAADRHIEILPEIDVPGHSMAAIAAYPELCVTRDTSIKVNPGSSFAKWFPKGGFEMYTDNTLDPTNERVYGFLDTVLSEVAALFPGPYIHIGGDECFKGYWEKDSRVQAFMKDHQLENTHELQAYFITRVNKIIGSKGKKLIGWDEILQGTVRDNVAVMNRFGKKGAMEQTRKGLDIVLAPGGNGLYFDYAQSASDMEPSSHGGHAPLWKSFVFDPEYDSLTAADKEHILGVEACLWTEHIFSMDKLYYMALPRLLGLSQTAWSQQQYKQWPAFNKDVLPVHLLRFDKAGINFRVPTATEHIDTTIKTSLWTLQVQLPLPGAKVYFTLNNTPPSEADHLYSAPVPIQVPDGKKIILKTIVITPAGRRSVITRTVLESPIILPPA